MDDTPIYVAGVFLHPKHRWNYFKRRWDTDILRDYLKPTEQKLRELWEKGYKNKITAD